MPAHHHVKMRFVYDTAENRCRSIQGVTAIVRGVKILAK